MDDNYKTPLIISAIEMAARNLDLHLMLYFTVTAATVLLYLRRVRRRPGPARDTQLVGRTRIWYDNTLAESFNAAIKGRGRSPGNLSDTEKRRSKTPYATSGSGLVGRVTRHSTPQEVDDEYQNQQLAA
jgi:hypothetical protein